MKLKKLEIELQKIKGFSNPKANLEQYITPPDLAARFLFDAFMHHDLEGMSVLDLGCGTGMLSIGAALLNANVTAVDGDRQALLIAEENAKEFGISTISFQEEKILETDAKYFEEYDTVIMNPPFGAQNEHADRPFIMRALQSAPVTWGIFNKGSIPFIKSYTKDIAEITVMVSARLNIPRQFSFHTHDTLGIPVEIVRLEKHSNIN